MLAFSLETITLAIAIWGAALSTTLAISKLISYANRARPKLKVTSTWVYESKTNPSTREFKLTVRNVGTVSTTVVAFYYVKYKKRFHRIKGLLNEHPSIMTERVADYPTPYKLEPGGHVQHIITVSADVERFIEADYVYLVVEDSYHDWIDKGFRTRLYRDMGAFIKDSLSYKLSRKTEKQRLNQQR